jgi:hypothetical protein
MLIISVAVMIGLSASAQTPDLWIGPNLPHNVRDLPSVASTTYVTVHQAAPGGDQFLLGASIIEHNGVFYANWANGPIDENSMSERVCGKRSTDGGQTWSEPEVIVPALPGAFARSHGPYLKHDGKLWFFGMRFDYPDAGGRNVNTEAFLLNEQTGAWDCFGIVASGGGMVGAPVRMANGNWIAGGVYTGFRACAYISHGDDFTLWDRINIPWPVAGNEYSETAIMVYGDKLIAIMRSNVAGAAGISVSEDYGRSWTTIEASDFPMVASKPFGGVLSNGQPYLVANVSDGGNDRDTLVIAVGASGEQSFSRMWKIRQGRTPQPLFEGRYKTPGWQYPYAHEYNGNLYVIYAPGKEDCELAIIPVSALSTAGDTGWVVPATGRLFSAVTWKGGSSTDWTDEANWTNKWISGSAPTSDYTTDVAEFTNSATVFRMPTINASRNVNGIDFDSAGWTIGSNGSSTLGLGMGGVTFDTVGPAGTNTIQPKIFLGTNQSWTVSTGNRLVVTSDSVTGARTLTKKGAGTLALSGKTNAMNGVAVSAGTLLVNSPSLFTASVTVSNAAILGGTGTVSATTTIANGGIISPGDNGAGALSISNLILNSMSVLEFDLSSLTGSNDRINTDNLILDGLLNVTNLGGLQEGVYTLFNYTGMLTDNGLQLNSVPYGFKGSIAASGGTVSLTVGAPATWDGSNSTDWTNGENWETGVAPANDYTTTVAKCEYSTPNMPTINASRNINGFHFAISGCTIGSNGSSTWGIGSSGVTFDAAGPGTNTIQSMVYLGINQSWNISARNRIVVNGNIGGAAATLTKAGEGTMAINGTSNSFGTAVVSAGTLLVNGLLDTRAATVTIHDAAVLGGAGTISRAVTIANGGIISPGDNGAGALSISNLILNSMSVLEFDLSSLAGSNDRINTGNLTLDGLINVTNLGGLQEGAYTLFNYTGTLTDNGLQLNSVPYGFKGSIAASGGTVRLNVLAAPGSVVTWDGSNNNSWTYGANWDTGVAPSNSYTTAIARFVDTNTVPYQPSIDASRNINGVHFVGKGWTIGSNGSSTWGIGSGGVTFDKASPSSDGTNATQTVVIQSGMYLGTSQSWNVCEDNQLIVSGNIGGAAATLTKIGFGRLVINGTSNSFGTAVVSVGTLLVNGLLDARATTVTVHDAAVLGGTGTISRATTIANGGVVDPGSNGAGTLNITTNLILNSMSVLEFELGSLAGSNDRINTGNLTLDGRLRITNLGGLQAGTYTLFNYTGTLTDNGLQIDDLPYGFEGSLSASGGTVRLILLAAMAWDGSNNIDWTNGSNWEPGVAPSNDYISAIARFVNSADVSYLPTVNANRNIYGVEFDGANWTIGSNGSSTWGIGSSGVTFNAAGPGTNTILPAVNLGTNQTWTVKTGNTLVVSGAISGAAATLTKGGGGTLVFCGTNSFGSTTVSAGTLLVNGRLDARAVSVTVSNAAVLGGTGTISRVTTIVNGGIIAPGNNGAGTLNITTNLTLNSTSILEFELDSLTGGNDCINTGALTLDGLLSVTSLGGLQAGAYTLVVYTGTLTNNGLQIDSLPAGFVGSISASNGTVSLIVTTNGGEAISTVTPASIINQEFAPDNIMKITVYVPYAPDRYCLGGTTNLMEGTWVRVPHSDSGTNAFVTTNMSYSATDGIYNVIYVQITEAAKFFNIMGE